MVHPSPPKKLWVLMVVLGTMPTLTIADYMQHCNLCHHNASQHLHLIRRHCFFCARDSPINILFVGDSVDRRLVQTVCAFLRSCNSTAYNKQLPLGSVKGRNVLTLCRAPTINLGFVHIPGVALEGPYWEGVEGNCIDRLTSSISLYMSEVNVLPEAVIISSNLWDTARMQHVSRDSFQESERLSWSRNVSLLFTHARLIHPHVKLFYHTTMLPAWKGAQQMVHDINAAGVEAARRCNVHVVDFVPLVSGKRPAEYLEDSAHPRPAVNLILANAVINAVIRETCLFK